MTKGKKNGVLEMLTELENKMETHPTVYGFQKDLKEIIKEVKEVITETCKKIYGGSFTEARLFLEENFNLENMGSRK
jgi:hypothetical protein